jgi:regulatory protein
MVHKVTALTSQKRNNQRINVYLDGEFAFGLSRIVAAWLQVGQEISDEKITELLAEDSQEVAYQRALNYISHRPRSESEVRKNLKKHDIADENIDYTMERLKRSGLIDDANFARLWVENRSEFRPRSRSALTYELRQRGVEDHIIDQTLDPLDDEALAYQAAIKRAPRFKELDWNSFRQKMYNYLAQRGFNYSTSKQVIHRAWAEIHDNDHSSEEIKEDEEAFL